MLEDDISDLSRSSHTLLLTLPGTWVSTECDASLHVGLRHVDA